MFEGIKFGLLIIIYITYTIALLSIGWAGIEYSFGAVWGWVSIILAIVLRFTLPIMFGAFLGAMHFWGWHWFVALIFVMPGIILMIPAIFITFIDKWKERKNSN